MPLILLLGVYLSSIIIYSPPLLAEFSVEDAKFGAFNVIFLDSVNDRDELRGSLSFEAVNSAHFFAENFA